MAQNLTIQAVTTDGGRQSGQFGVFINENIVTETKIGKLVGIDFPGTNFTIVAEEDYGGRFGIIKEGSDYYLYAKDGGSQKFDYEDPTYDAFFSAVTFKFYEGSTLRHQAVFDVELNDIVNETSANQNPSSLTFTDGSTTKTVQENQAGATVGTLQGQDPDVGQTLSYTLVNDPSGKFEVVGTTLKLKAGESLDYENSGASHSYTVTVRVSDGQGGFRDQAFTINVTDVADTNMPPSAPAVVNNQVAAVSENATASQVVATVQSTDDGQGGALFYSIVTNPGNKFTINAGSGEIILLANSVIDYETDPNLQTDAIGRYYNVVVKATESTGGQSSGNTTVKVYVTDVNERPTDLSLSGTSVSSTAGGGALIGNLTSTDPDAGFSPTYSIAPNGDPNNLFQVSGGQLQVRSGATLTPGNYNVTLRVSDGSLTYDETFTITVTNGNGAPSQPSLSNASINENSEVNAVIGNLSATDPNGDAVSYTFSNGQLTDPSGRFKIVNNNGTWQIQVANKNLLNHEAQATQDITIVVSDGKGGTAQKLFTIAINNVNEAPTDLSLSGTSVSSTAGGGALIGNLTSTDPDAGFSPTYSIAPNGDPNNLFQVSGGQLQVRSGATLTPGNYNVTLRVSDGSLTYDETFTITVTQGNTAPTNVRWISNDSTTTAIDENTTAVGTVTATDSGAVTYSFAANGNPNNLFSINQTTGVVTLANGVDYEAMGTNKFYDLIVVASDGSLTTQQTLRVTINNVNERPTDIILSTTSVAESAQAGDTVATLGATDPDANSAFSYAIVSDPESKFEIVGNQLRVRQGATLDYELDQSHQVTIRVSDGTLTYDETFTITVTNVAENGAPIISGNPNGLQTVSDRNIIQPFQALSITDEGTLEVRISGFAGKGVIANLPLGAILNPEAGTLFFSGSASMVTEAIKALQFDPRDKAFGSAQEFTSFTIEVKDSGGLTTTKTVDVAATTPPAPDNRAPTDISFSGVSSFVEMPLNGTPLGTLGASDPDDAGGFVYSIVNSDGRFQIVGNQLQVANGSLFDFETQSAHSVTLRVTDKNGSGLSYTETFTFGLTDGVDVFWGTNANNTLRGTAGPDKLYGLKGKDKLYGGTGDDVINGGEGNDTLYGQKGKNAFVFDAKLGTSSTDRKVNFDAIKDFVVKDDSIWLDDKIFKNAALKKLGKGASETNPKQLTSKFFKVGDAAKDKDDYIIYNKATGVLSYDSDGSGSKAAIEIAQLSKKLKMTYKDFFII